MKENGKNIDHLFRDGVHKDYPMDTALWNQVAGSLPKGKKPFGFLLDSILVLLCLLAFLLPQTNQGSDSMAENGQIINPQEHRSSRGNRNQEYPANSVTADDGSFIQDQASQSHSADGSGSLAMDTGAGHGTPTMGSPENGKDFHPKKSPPPGVAETTNESSHQELGYTLPVFDAIDLLERPFYGWSFGESFFQLNGVQKPSAPKHRRVMFYSGMDLDFSVHRSKKLELPTPANEAYRKEHEAIKTLQSRRFYVGISSRHFFLESGIGLTQFMDEYDYPIAYEVKLYTVSEGPLQILQDRFIVDGQEVVLIGRPKDTTVTTTQVNAQNTGQVRLSYLNVPIRLGYIHDWGRVELRSWIRPEIHMLRSWSGNYIDLSPGGLPLETGDMSKHHNLLSLGGGVDIGYRLTSHWVIRVSLSGSSMMQSTHIDFNQRLRWLSSGVTLNRYF